MSKFWKIILIAGLILTGIIILIIILSKKKGITFTALRNALTMNEAFRDIESTYGTEIARNTEAIMRLETAHFTSVGYRLTNGAGMLKQDLNFPYGFTSLRTFWNSNPEFAPTDIINMRGSDGMYYDYLKFKGNGQLYTIAEFLKTHGNNAGRWNSTEQAQQDYYNNIISNITTTYIV